MGLWRPQLPILRDNHLPNLDRTYCATHDRSISVSDWSDRHVETEANIQLSAWSSTHSPTRSTATERSKTRQPLSRAQAPYVLPDRMLFRKASISGRTIRS